MKKGIALLITLFFVILIIGIAGSIMSVYNKYSKDNFYKNISQNSVLIKDVKNILNRFCDEINSSEELDYILGEFPVYSRDGRFSADINISILNDKINLNELAVKQTQEYIVKYLMNVLNSYEISDPQFFIDLLLDTVDEDNLERNAYSEIKNYDSSFINGKIYNFRQFKYIMDVYSKARDDENIYTIPWKKFVYFGKKEIEPIDAENISDENAKFLGLKFEGVFDYEAAEKNKENRKIMQILDIIPFNKKENFFIKTEIKYYDQNITLIYNISKKKVTDIEYNFLY